MKKTTKASLMVSAGLSSLLVVSSQLQAAELHIIATGALRGAMQHLQPAYEKASGNKLLISWGPSMGESPDSIPQRVLHKEPMDLAIMAAETLDQLSGTGSFEMATRTQIASSRIGVGVPKGQPKPDVSSVDALRQSLLNAKRVAYSQGASGVYISTTLFNELGISEQMKSKSVVIEGKELVGTALARGDAELGMQQVSELKVTPGVDFVGPLPDKVQKISLFTAVVAKQSTQSAAAKSFIEYLTSKPAIQLLEESGLEPGKTL
ncbi:molybdenum ABC transporter substrate-binding protein [Pseudomonas fluorescens HK44]|uniref:Molybdenum ABC transporter substrate-binding protein n=2 Tax=Pseudomonas fluorescens TaxID=294 RepID=A0A010SK50_PSEFL|nr:molybdenum ABC transporter substrate-binding protein [Pseudomonas fluorescens HK44]